jgi:hypothetical protein
MMLSCKAVLVRWLLCCLQSAADGAQCGAETGADGGKANDCHDGDQGSDHSVFEGGDGTVVSAHGYKGAIYLLHRTSSFESVQFWTSLPAFVVPAR